jgi:hypothetical protein
MKCCGFLILLFTFAVNVNGQNLVPNPGFEHYKHLPCELGLYSMEALLTDWIQPIPTTPDYWNSLAEPECLLNPIIVNDSARTGNGMVGIVTTSFEAGSMSSYRMHPIVIEAIAVAQVLRVGGSWCVDEGVMT